MSDLDRLAEIVGRGVMTHEETRVLVDVAAELIAVARHLRATVSESACPERRCPYRVGAGDRAHPCSLCGAMRALDARLDEVMGER